MRLYFAHNFDKRKEYRKLELELEKEFNIELFNPFYDEASRKEEMEAIDNGKKPRVADVASELIVRRDLKNLADGQGLFTIIENPSIGTTLEIANAKLMCKKYIIVVSEKHWNHLWLQEYATHRFSTLEDFKKWATVEFRERYYCKYCLRELPDKDWETDNGCIWCDTKRNSNKTCK